MTATDKTTLKSYFNTNDIPTETQFADFIDTIGILTLGVAASNASDSSKGRADYICDGVNDEVQIQAAIDALPASGGKIVFSEGTFICAKGGARAIDPVMNYCMTIDQTDGKLWLDGMGRATIFKLADGQDANTPIVLVQGLTADKRLSSTLITGIEFDGNETGQVASWVDFGLVTAIYSDEVTLDRCYLHSSPHQSFHFLRNCLYCRITNNRVESNSVHTGAATEVPNIIIAGNDFRDDLAVTTGSLISLVANADIGVVSEKCSVQNNIFTGGFVQLTLSGAKHCTVFGNLFRDVTDLNSVALKLEFFNSIIADYNCLENMICANVFENIRDGIYVTGDASNGSLRNHIVNNQIIEGAGVGLSYGILQSGAASLANYYAGNRIVGANLPISIAAGTAIVEHNIGYVTESYGATSVADGGTISHGLAATPTVVIVTTSVADEYAAVTALAATNFTVALTKHDGSAGTTQTIYWRAYI